MSIIPPYLKAGDTIGIVAPAGYMSAEKMSNCIDMLQQWGYTVKMGATTHSQSENYFSGTDAERLSDLQDMINDPEVKAILCARGGYGTSRIIDQLRFKRLRQKPKWIIGFSDITVLHAHLLRKYRIASLHAPMAAAFNDVVYPNPYLASLRDALEGKPAEYHSHVHALNRPGSAKGMLVGGNLSLLIHLIGTPSDIKTKNRILFLEDIGEYRYSIDRMMVHLKRAGKLDALQGLIIGGFTDIKDTERPFGQEVEAIIRSHVDDRKYPVCFGFPVSHERENLALKIGVNYSMEVSGEGVALKELR